MGLPGGNRLVAFTGVIGTARYDWEGMYITLMVRIHDQGLPATQAEWLGEVQEWFVANGDGGEVLDERTIRRRLTPIWKALRGSC